jgi:hypothetical protein
MLARQSSRLPLLSEPREHIGPEIPNRLPTERDAGNTEALDLARPHLEPGSHFGAREHRGVSGALEFRLPVRGFHSATVRRSPKPLRHGNRLRHNTLGVGFAGALPFPRRCRRVRATTPASGHTERPRAGRSVGNAPSLNAESISARGIGKHNMRGPLGMTASDNDV